MDNSIFLDSEAYNKPREILNYMHDPMCEMEPIQLDFLCGMIKQRRPKKLLEIGVAEGGTSSVIMQCLMEVCPDCKMFSIDLNDRLYYDSVKETGYLLNEVKDRLSNICNHKFLLGRSLPEFIDYIGSDIDFVVLDTVHRLPGELLDFLCVLPFLSRNATVVLHDTIMGTSFERGINDGLATGVLFSAACGDKYWSMDRLGHLGIANIAALSVNDDTYNKVGSVFFALSLPWSYIPTENELSQYRKIFSRYYCREYLELFDNIVFTQKKSYAISGNNLDKDEWNDIIDQISGKKIYLYGAGKYAKRLEERFNKDNISVRGFVVSDDQDISGQSEIIKKSDYIKLKDDNVLIYAIKSDEAFYALAKDGIPVLYLNKKWMV